MALGFTNPSDNHSFASTCGGTIISNKTVLTAAHCLTSSSVEQFQRVGHFFVAVGEHNTFQLDQGQNFEKVCNITIHPKYIDYNGTYSIFDYGILTLCDELNWSNKVSPICLPESSGRGSMYENKKAIVAGWGNRNGSYNSISYVLQEAIQTTMNNEDCKAHSTSHTIVNRVNYTKVNDQMICGLNEQQSICYGDSGGPLIVKEDGKEAYTLVGIVSWGNDFCHLGEPGVYARVTQELDWIKINIQGSRCA